MDNSSAGQLFAEFPSPARQEWLDLVNGELDGASASDTLIWKTFEEFEVQPLYTAEDLTDLPHLDTLPGFPPFVRGSAAEGRFHDGWSIDQEVSDADPYTANERLLAGLHTGQTGAVLRFADNGGTPLRSSGIRADTLSDFAALLAGVHAEALPLHIVGGAASFVHYALLHAWAEEGNIDPAALTGSLAFDPLGDLVSTGKSGWDKRTREDLGVTLIRHARQNCPAFKPLTVSSAPYHDAGASVVQELAFALAAGVEYFDALQQDGLSVPAAMQWVFPVGTNFFFEIAKLRVARMLWAKILHHFGEKEQSLRMTMRTESSRRSRTMYDANVNMLRATLEVMAGALGGADAVTCTPFDSCLRTADDFSSRLARNTQIILQQEAHLARVIDPAGGSFYIERLTDDIGRHTWALFQEIERLGGFLKAFESGWAQEQISGIAAMRHARMSKRRDVLIGTNQYPNLGESLADHLRMRPEEAAPQDKRMSVLSPDFSFELKAAFSSGTGWIERIIRAFKDGATIDEIREAIAQPETGEAQRFAPLSPYRSADQFERIRMAAEGLAKRPVAFLATLGPASWRRARATFSAGLLGIAGFDIADNTGYASVEDAAKAITALKPDIVVACSDDESYPVLVPELIAALRGCEPRPLFLVAGNPTDHIEELRLAGVDDFIHMRTDAGVFLAELLGRLGIDANADLSA
jgi:methylmalonyl-CoA mutase